MILLNDCTNLSIRAVTVTVQLQYSSHWDNIRSKDSIANHFCEHIRTLRWFYFIQVWCVFRNKSRFKLYKILTFGSIPIPARNWTCSNHMFNMSKSRCENCFWIFRYGLCMWSFLYTYNFKVFIDRICSFIRFKDGFCNYVYSNIYEVQYNVKG